MAVCYCLCSADNKRTYVGATVNMKRRLRQHNGIIKGGARYTTAMKKKHGEWRVVATVHGFASWRDALKFEWRWKHVRRGRRQSPRSKRFVDLAALLTHKPWKFETLFVLTPEKLMAARKIWLWIDKIRKIQSQK